jgi:nicotinamidase-related amidase
METELWGESGGSLGESRENKKRRDHENSLIVDIQKDYFPGGKMELVEPLKAAEKAYVLLQCFREHGGQHVHIQHISTKPDARYFIPGDRGTDIHDSVAHFEGEPIVYKHFPNSFRETNLLEMLREWGIERVVICGMMTICVWTRPRERRGTLASRSSWPRMPARRRI